MFLSGTENFFMRQLFLQVFLGGFGSALRKAAGSGSAKNECGSTALVLVMNEVTVGVGVG